MRNVPRIEAAYRWMVAAYDREVADAIAAGGGTDAIDGLSERREQLERGVFVTLFAEFEREVGEVLKDARDARRSNPDWTQRRGWDAPALDDRRPSFETRLSMVMDRDAPAYRAVIAAYAQRNACAHGATTVSVSSIDALVQDLYMWQSRLRR